MPVPDVPVEADQVFLFFLQAVARLAAAVVVVDALRDAVDALVVRLAQPFAFVAVAGTAVAPGQETRRLRILVGREEEQPVFEDRSADAEAAIGLVVGHRAAIVVVVVRHGVAAEVLARVLVESAKLEFVHARLGDRVDVAGREAAVGHVEGREFDGHLFQRVIRERLADGRCVAVLVQAEAVRLAHAV